MSYSPKFIELQTQFMEELFSIEYSSYATMASNDESKYLTEINGSILVFDEDEKLIDIAGKFSFMYVNISLAEQDGFSLYELFDSDHDLLVISECIWDGENDVLKSIDAKNFDIFNGDNLFVLQFIEISEKYRGRNLSVVAIKDAISRFGNGCSLMVFRLFTLQHTPQDPINEEEKKWLEKLNLDALEADEEQAFYKLAAFFQSIGFTNIEDDVFALNLAYTNKLDDFSIRERD